MKRPEILAPASSLEVLKTAIQYGADAVYIGGEAYWTAGKSQEFFHGRHERRHSSLPTKEEKRCMLQPILPPTTEI